MSELTITATSARWRRYDVVEKHGKRCHLCSLPIGLRWLHVDHLMPRSWSGCDHLENLRPSHSWCNQAKGNRARWLYCSCWIPQIVRAADDPWWLRRHSEVRTPFLVAIQIAWNIRATGATDEEVAGFFEGALRERGYVAL